MKNMTEQELMNILGHYLYKTQKVLQESQTTCHIHYARMFNRLDKKTAQELLNCSKIHDFFHPMNIDYYQRIIDGEIKGFQL